MATNNRNVPTSGGGFRQPPLEAAGYLARVVQVIDYGLQSQPDYKGESKDPAYEVGLTYELVDEFMIDEEGNVQEDKPRWISETFPLRHAKADKAKSTLRYNVLDPTDKFKGEFLDLVGAPCTVNIIQNPGKGKNVGKVFNNVASLTPVKAKDLAKMPELVNDPITFSLDDPDLEVFNNLPDWVADKIKGNLEFNGSKLQKLLGGEVVDNTTDNYDPEDQDVAEDKTPW